MFLKVVFMTQGRRVRLSAEQRTDMWRRLKAGTNTITLTVPAGTLTAGIIYDYLRLELE
jgi:hypothetical protein